MSFHECLGRVLDLCCEAIGEASMILLPTFFMSSFAVMACLIFSSSRSIILFALIFCGSMITVTSMIVAGTRRCKRADAYRWAPKPIDRSSAASRASEQQIRVPEEGQSCGLCGQGRREYRLDCRWKARNTAPDNQNGTKPLVAKSGHTDRDG
jgi:hypothetical protein